MLKKDLEKELKKQKEENLKLATHNMELMGDVKKKEEEIAEKNKEVEYYDWLLKNENQNREVLERSLDFIIETKYVEPRLEKTILQGGTEQIEIVGVKDINTEESRMVRHLRDQVSRLYIVPYKNAMDMEASSARGVLTPKHRAR